MKILYFLDYGKEYGGAVNTLLQQAFICKEFGHFIEVFKSDYCGSGFGEQYLYKLREYGITPKEITYQISNEPEDIDVCCIDDNYEKSLEVIRNLEPDILHSVQINPMVELVSRELCIPHIMNIYPLMDDFFKFNYSDIFPKHMTCDSMYWGEQWKRYLNLDYRCVRTAVMNCDDRYREFDENNLRCIMVGAVYKGKNQLEVIKGFAKAIKKGFSGTLEIYGQTDTGYAQECEKYISDNGLNKNILINGYWSDIDSVYRKSDILICGSVRESYPNVISEAFSHGLIVISTSVAGVPEVLRDGENGLLTDGYDSDAFCKVLVKTKRLVESRVANDISAAAIETAKSIHSKKAVYDELFDYYQKVIQDNYNYESHYFINDFREDFKECIEKYRMNEQLFSDSCFIRTKLWYLRSIMESIRKLVQQDKNFYLWGAGNNGKKVLEMIKCFFTEVEIKAVIDSNKTGDYCGYSIVSPMEYLSDEDGVVFISIYNGQADVIEKLAENDKKYGMDYFIMAPRGW